jgi:hypothetical protein
MCEGLWSWWEGLWSEAASWSYRTEQVRASAGCRPAALVARIQAVTRVQRTRHGTRARRGTRENCVTSGQQSSRTHHQARALWKERVGAFADAGRRHPRQQRLTGRRFAKGWRLQWADLGHAEPAPRRPRPKEQETDVYSPEPPQSMAKPASFNVSIVGSHLGDL